jgi:hypothetical protein
MGRSVTATCALCSPVVGILLAAACGQTAADPGGNVVDSGVDVAKVCELAIVPEPIDDPCEGLDKDACCATDGCGYHDSHELCVNAARVCFGFSEYDVCGPTQRCYRKETPQSAKEDCTNIAEHAFSLRGICVENPRELCFDRCAKWRSLDECCLDPGCAWHSGHGLCVSEELDCTDNPDDPAACPEGLRCETQWYWAHYDAFASDPETAGVRRSDCVAPYDFTGRGLRGVCTPDPGVHR